MDISDVVILLGGVAMFLFGMSLMGDGLKKVAGNQLELILYRLSSGEGASQPPTDPETREVVE